MPRVTDEHRAAMRERIRDAAMEVVRTKGLAALTMADIITESGLSAGAIYGYYKGKDVLVADLVRSVMTGRLDLMTELAERSPVPAPTEALTALLESLPDEWLRGGLLLQVWGVAAHSPDLMLGQAKELSASMSEAVEAYLVAWLRQQGTPAAAARLRAREITPAFTGLMQGYVMQFSLLGRFTAEEYAAAASAIFEGALRGGSEPPSP